MTEAELKRRHRLEVEAKEREIFARALEPIVGHRPGDAELHCGFWDQRIESGLYHHHALGTTLYMRPGSADPHVYIEGLMGTAKVESAEGLDAARSSLRSQNMVVLLPALIIVVCLVSCVASLLF